MPDAPHSRSQTRFVPLGTRVDTKQSIQGGGQLGNLTISLVNDQDPAGFSYYGTDIFGTRGWYGAFIPSGPQHTSGLVPDPGAIAGTTRYLCEDGLWKVVISGGGGGSGSSISNDVTQTSHGFAVGNVVRFNGTNYVKALADTSGNAEVVGIVTSVTDANNFTLTTGGQVTSFAGGLTAGSVYFLSTTTAGLLTATAPSTSGQISKPLLIASSTTGGYWFNWRGWTLGTGGGGGGGSGTLTSLTASTPIIVTPSPITTTGVISLDATSKSNWDSAYADRMKWDGGATGLVAATGRTSLGLVIGTDVSPATSGNSILYGNGAGGFSNVTIGANLTFSGGTLSASGGGGAVSSVSGTSPITVSPTTGATVVGLDVGIDHNFTVPQTITLIDAVTNIPSDVFVLRHNSAGSVSGVFGTQILFKAESSTTNDRIQGSVGTSWYDPTDATRVGMIRFRAADTTGISAGGVYIYPGDGLSAGNNVNPGSGVINAGGGFKVGAASNAVAGSFLMGVSNVFNASPYTLPTSIGTSGQIMRSNGSTGFTLSTAQYPATAGTSGNVMTSDGINWTSAAPASGGTVTDFSAGDLSPLFTTTEATTTTTPALSFVLTSAAATTVFGRAAGTSGAPTYSTSPQFLAIGNLTTNGFVKTGGGVGTLSVDTSTYLTANQNISLTGDVTGGPSATSIATTIGSNKVTLANMATITTDSILGRATAATGNVEVLTALPFAYTGDVTRPADSNVTTLAAGNAGNLNSGTLLAARMPALTGDVTTTTGAVATTIANSAVTYAKMQNVSATSRFLGRITSGAGVVEELTAANAKTILALTSTDVGLGNVTNNAQTQSSIVPNTAPSAGQILVGNVGGTAYAPQTLGTDATLASTGALTIANGAVTLAKMANMATASLIYRKTAGSGAPEVNTLATLKTDLSLTGTNSGDQTITLTGDVTGSGTGSFAATISANAVTYAKMQAVSATSLLLGSSASTTAVQEITLGTNLSMSGTTLNATGGGGGGGGSSIGEGGITSLVSGQAYIDVTFSTAQADALWELAACEIVNTVDSTPLNISPGVFTSKTTTGFRLQLIGLPDTSNYTLHWSLGVVQSGVITQNPQATNYTLALADSGKHIFHDSATAHTYTIPANSSVAFPIGTTITLVNNTGGGVVTLAITTDTLRRGDGTAGTGSRTISADSVATILKTKSTEWMITGKFS